MAIGDQSGSGSTKLINNLDAGNPLLLQSNDNSSVSIRECDILTILPTCVCDGRTSCTCDAKAGSAKHTQLIRLMQFLMGLNDVYQPIRSTILAKDHFHNVKDAFYIVYREESHRGLHPGSSFVNKSKPATFVVKTNNNPNNFNMRVNIDNNNNTNRGPNPNLFCKNYGLIGHTVDRFYELISYPASFKRNPNLSKQSGNTKRYNADSKVNQSVPSTSGYLSACFTNEHVMKLLSLINEKPSPSANMSDIKPSFYNSNVFFNLHFEKFFCAKSESIMYNVTLGLIIDYGANQHMTDSTKDMFNVF
ncbi:hypothetical protein Tco_0670667 [Tanacetum coccineum]